MTGDYLWWQWAASLEPEDEELARFLIASLDDRGFLMCSEEEVSVATGAPEERVAILRSRLQALDPPGVGARDAQECLLIQLTQLESQAAEPLPLVRRFLEECWLALGRGAVRQVQRKLGISRDHGTIFQREFRGPFYWRLPTDEEAHP